jgi:hypothetical protein
MFYYKGGEMERLLNGRTFVTFAFIRRLDVRNFFGVLFFVFVIGDVPTAALELKRGSRDQLLDRPLAINAFSQRFRRHDLQSLKNFSAGNAPVFVDRHSLYLLRAIYTMGGGHLSRVKLILILAGGET